jgi:tRNA threonylcarbamoyladenosine biosynthesis protein TsaE
LSGERFVEYLRAAGVQPLNLPSEEDTRALGAAVARVVRPGDVIALRGGLGAGKTTFARGFIRHLTGSPEEVVSPTFTLVQTYEASPAEIWHFDLYRLAKAEDVFELGLDDALTGGIVLIEWPERMERLLPPRRLDVELTVAGSGRQARLAGDASWSTRINAVRDDVERT